MYLYIYSRPPAARVRIILDSGVTAHADVPVIANGRDDAHLLELPDDTPYQGSTLHVEADGYHSFDGRGILTPGADHVEAKFQFDDIYLQPLGAPLPPVTPPPSGPPNPADPFGIIRWVYGDGTGFDLWTHEGCGQFTEACAVALFQYNDRLWGHVEKMPGQNQYNGHAVDAVHLLAGSEAGIYDIITDSVSHNAEPAYNYAGPPDPNIWYPAIGSPLTATRRAMTRRG